MAVVAVTVVVLAAVAWLVIGTERTALIVVMLSALAVLAFAAAVTAG